MEVGSGIYDTIDGLRLIRTPRFTAHPNQKPRPGLLVLLLKGREGRSFIQCIYFCWFQF